MRPMREENEAALEVASGGAMILKKGMEFRDPMGDRWRINKVHRRHISVEFLNPQPTKKLRWIRRYEFVRDWEQV